MMPVWSVRFWAVVLSAGFIVVDKFIAKVRINRDRPECHLLKWKYPGSQGVITGGCYAVGNISAKSGK